MSQHCCKDPSPSWDTRQEWAVTAFGDSIINRSQKDMKQWVKEKSNSVTVRVTEREKERQREGARLREKILKRDIGMGRIALGIVLACELVRTFGA